MTTKRKSAPAYKDYPKSDEQRSGIKVSWLYYKDRAMADEAAVAAKHNAAIQASLGYDFGYCSPGYVTAHQEFHPGMFEVCIP